jgi:hypothetical protein
MDLTRVQDKLAEAQFFLDKMTKQEPRVVGDRRPFDYYLSAFLSAGRTIDYRLRHEQSKLYAPWRSAWDAKLTPQEDALIKFMVDDRNKEIHESGSARDVGQEGVEFGIGTHPVDGGTITVGGIPAPLSGVKPTVTLYRPTYSFSINGVDRKVTEASVKYLALLQRMVAQFEAEHA